MAGAGVAEAGGLCFPLPPSRALAPGALRRCVVLRLPTATHLSEGRREAQSGGLGAEISTKRCLCVIRTSRGFVSVYSVGGKCSCGLTLAEDEASSLNGPPSPAAVG